MKRKRSRGLIRSETLHFSLNQISNNSSQKNATNGLTKDEQRKQSKLGLTEPNLKAAQGIERQTSSPSRSSTSDSSSISLDDASLQKNKNLKVVNGKEENSMSLNELKRKSKSTAKEKLKTGKKTSTFSSNSGKKISTFSSSSVDAAKLVDEFQIANSGTNIPKAKNSTTLSTYGKLIKMLI